MWDEANLNVLRWPVTEEVPRVCVRCLAVQRYRVVPVLIRPAMGDRVPYLGAFLPPHTRPPPCIAFFCVFWSLQGHFFPSPPPIPDRFLFPLSLIHRIITSITFGIAVVVDGFTFLSLALLRIPSLLSGPSHSLRLNLFTLFSRLHCRPNRGKSSTRVCPRISVPRIFARALYALRSAGAADWFN
jgi:hypothetical protein